MKSIAIIGATYYGNRGAEAMLSATVSHLSECYKNSIQFNVFSYYPCMDRRLVSDSRVKIHSAKPAYLVSVLLPSALLYQFFGWLKLDFLQRALPNSVQALAKSKALLCLAGISFVDGRTKFLPYNIATLGPALILGVPVVKLAQALGPFETWPNRLAAQFVLAHCFKIFARGERTFYYLQKLLGPSLHVQRADDVAFLFRTQDCISQDYPGLEPRLERLAIYHGAGRIVIGVCPSSVLAKRLHKTSKDYIAWLDNLIQALVEKGYVVALYPNATRGEDMDKSHNNDLPIISLILMRLKPGIRESVVAFDGSWSVAQIYRIVNLCELHIVSRFHAMIAALSSAVPVLVIGWSHKYLEVMSSFGQADMVLDESRCDLELVMVSIERLLQERYKRSICITNALLAAQESARRQFDHVLALLD
ncbi:MAG: polysaccharide pyruvyl transferase family protein [Halochromatium sp.]